MNNISVDISTREEIETLLLEKKIFGIRENKNLLFIYKFNKDNRNIQVYNYNNPSIKWSLDLKSAISKLYKRGPYINIDGYYINTDKNFKEEQ